MLVVRLPCSRTMEGTITEIAPQRRQAGRRFNVFLNGRYAFSLHQELAGSLRVGQSLSSAEVDGLLGRDQFQRALDAAVVFLSYRPRSEQEVRQRLEERYEPGLIASVLDKLRGWGVLDDEEFARYWVQQRRAFRPRGARALKMELLRKGIGAETAAEASLAGDEEVELAYRAAARKAEALGEKSFADFRQRLGAFLARRGFDWETINTVVRRLWSEKAESSRQ